MMMPVTATFCVKRVDVRLRAFDSSAWSNRMVRGCQ